MLIGVIDYWRYAETKVAAWKAASALLLYTLYMAKMSYRLGSHDSTIMYLYHLISIDL